MTVNERVKAFREHYAEYSLETELVEITKDTALMRAVIRDKEGRLIATGTAYERTDNAASMVNKTSHVENCETSAWGRALANFGIGIDESIASAQEVANAVATQEKAKPAPVKASRAERKPTDKCSSGEIVQISKLCKDTETELPKLYEHFGVVNSVPTNEQAEKMIVSLQAKFEKQSKVDVGMNEIQKDDVPYLA